MVKNIAISGKAKSGKDTAATRIRLEFGEMEIVAFADPIKELVLKMFPEADRRCLYGASELRQNIIPGDYIDDIGNQMTYRQALIDIGTLGRKYNPNKWINEMNSRLKLLNKPVIISDCRFINEYEWLKLNNFYLVRIARNSASKINDKTETEQDAIPDDKFDKLIFNDGSIDEFYNKIIVLIEDIKKI